MRPFDFAPLYRSSVGFDRLVQMLERRGGGGVSYFPGTAVGADSVACSWTLAARKQLYPDCPGLLPALKMVEAEPETHTTCIF